MSHRHARVTRAAVSRGVPEAPAPAPPRVPAIILSLVGFTLCWPLFAWLHDAGLLVGPPWALAALAAVAGLSSSRWSQRLIGSGDPTSRPVLRLVLGYTIFTTFAWVAGWSFLLPASVVVVAVPHIQRSGSRVWRPAAGLAVLFTVVSEVAVHLGVSPTVIGVAESHLASVLTLLMSLIAVANVGLSVADREAAANALARTEARLRALMDSSTDVLTVSDRTGALTYVSPAVERTMGYSPETILGSPLLQLVDSDYRPDVELRLEQVVAAGPQARTSFDVLVAHATSERRWYEWTVHNLLADQLVQGLVVDQRDVTERLLHQAALAQAAAHDELTGLVNRGELMRRLALALPEAAPGAGVAVLFLDLDHFKEVNDTLGHATGDQLLVVVAKRLSACLRPHDHLARLGGDEFCVILTEIGTEREVAGVVARLETAVATPVALDAGTVRVGVSIGSVLTTDGSRDAAQLFAQADAAMYAVKHSRPGR